MKLIATLAAFAVLACLSTDASAQDGKKKGERGGKKREAILKKFDKDGDGKLSKEERAAAREFKAKRQGEEGRGGKLRRMIMRRFDKDGDHQLNESERESLKKFLDSRHRGDRKRRSR